MVPGRHCWKGVREEHARTAGPRGELRVGARFHGRCANVGGRWADVDFKLHNFRRNATPYPRRRTGRPTFVARMFPRLPAPRQESDARGADAAPTARPRSLAPCECAARCETMRVLWRTEGRRQSERTEYIPKMRTARGGRLQERPSVRGRDRRAGGDASWDTCGAREGCSTAPISPCRSCGPFPAFTSRERAGDRSNVLLPTARVASAFAVYRMSVYRGRGEGAAPRGSIGRSGARGQRWVEMRSGIETAEMDVSRGRRRLARRDGGGCGRARGERPADGLSPRVGREGVRSGRRSQR